MSKKLFIFFLGLGLLISPVGKVFAYDDKTTHPALTQEIVDFYNAYSGNQITSQQKEWIIQGGINEDKYPRWLNHFYDPISGEGWSGEKAGNIPPSVAKAFSSIALITEGILSAVKWVNSPLVQETYSRYGGDYTWKKAMDYYADGNTEESYKTLGHALHILEDMSVPEHTRNDTHAQAVSNLTGDEGSPYEQYTARYNPGNIKELNIASNLKKGNLNPVIKNSIEDYLISLAQYSNKYFFSKDTTDGSKYQFPKIVREDENFGYGFDENNKEFPLVIIDSKNDKNNKPTKTYSIKNKEEYYPILNAYFTRLSRQTVLHGAGVIQLFQDKGKEAVVNKEYPVHAVKYDTSMFTVPAISLVTEFRNAFIATQSFFAQIGSTINNVVSAVGDFFSGIVGSENNLQPAGQIKLQSSGAEMAPVEQANSTTGQPVKNQASVPINTKQPTSLTAAHPPPAPPSETKEPISPKNEAESQVLGLETQQAQKQGQITATTTSATSTVAGQQSAAVKQCSFNSSQIPSRQKVIINEIAWMGTTDSANNEWIELKNVSGGEIDLTNWQLIDKDEQIKINLGSINRTKVTAGSFILLERTDDSSVPGVTADLIYVGALSNTNEGLRLFDNQCNLIDEAIANPDWPAGNSSEKKTAERDKNGFGWHTSSIAGGTPRQENSEATVYYSSGGGGSSSSNDAQNQNQAQYPKILINEIQTYPTENRFIELYNPNNSPIGLTNWYLQRKTQSGTSFGSLISKTYFEGKTINAHSYFLISRTALDGADIVLSNLTLTESNIIQLKNPNSEVVDKVGWGQANDCEGNCALEPSSSQSIQRKFQNNAFIGTDNNAFDFEIQTCPSPKAQSRTCQSASVNQAPGAFFVYTPQSPIIGETVLFNAASSTDPDPDGQITSYQWNFGDNTSSSISTATTTHSYSQAGGYSVNLVVFDNQNVSSTATSTTIFINPSQSAGVNHLVISEIMAGASTGHSDEEFIELYNPTNETIGLNGWSLERKTSYNSTSTPLNLVSNFAVTSTIPAKGFFLVAHQDYLNYSTSTQPDFFYTNNSNQLAYDDDMVILYNNSEIIDEITYQNIEVGQSIERKAFNNNQCVSVSGDGEFLGNGCDNDYDNDNNYDTTDFKIRDIPNPQNSFSFPEPRSAPTTPQNFSVQYGSSTVELIFDWQTSQDYSGAISTLTYRITDISQDSSTLSIIETTTSTTAKTSINEIGRDYNFSIRAFDREGLGSATSTAAVSVPSFLSNLYFYQDPMASSTDYLLEAYYDSYPFLPDLYWNSPASTWKILVFYLNSDAAKNSETLFEGTAPVMQPSDLANVFRVTYQRCSGAATTANSLILPDAAARCDNSGGAMSAGLIFTELEDKHFLVKAAVSSADRVFTPADYLTVAYYSTYDWSMGRGFGFRLEAVDKTKYYFQNQIPAHQLPELSGTLQLSFDKPNSRLNLNWDRAIDKDTLDNLLYYEVNFSTSTVSASTDFMDSNWQSVGSQNSFQKNVAPGNSFTIGVRAKDDFGNISTSTIANSWIYPETQFYISQINSNGWSPDFGWKQGDDSQAVRLQSIVPQADFQFDKVILRIKQTSGGDFAGLRLAVYPDDGADHPNVSIQGTSTEMGPISRPDENQDLVFTFASPIFVTAGSKYWLVLDVSGYYVGNQWSAFQTNKWQNATKSGNPYPDGVSGGAWCHVGPWSCGGYSPSAENDWYMKIGLSPQ